MRSAALLGLGLTLALAPAAHASTASVTVTYGSPHDGGDQAYVTYTAAPGEINALQASADPTTQTVRFVDSGATITAGAGCATSDPHTVACSTRPAVSAVPVIDLGDMDDTASLGDGFWSVSGGEGADHLDATGDTNGPAILMGGPGDDVLQAGPVGSTLYGGAGSDELEGGPDRDLLSGDGDGFDAPGDPPYAADVLSGGGGEDTVDYSYRTSPVDVDLQRSDAGATGEHDQISGIEDIKGPLAPSRLAGDDGPNVLEGIGTLLGRGGNDQLLATGLGPAALDGGPGDDLLEGEAVGPGAVITCGTGRDETRPAASLASSPVLSSGCEIIRYQYYDVLGFRAGASGVDFQAVAQNAGLCAGGIGLYGARGENYGTAAWHWKHRHARIGEAVRVHVTLSVAGGRAAARHARALVHLRRTPEQGVGCQRSGPAAAIWHVVL